MISTQLLKLSQDVAFLETTMQRLSLQQPAPENADKITELDKALHFSQKEEKRLRGMLSSQYAELQKVLEQNELFADQIDRATKLNEKYERTIERYENKNRDLELKIEDHLNTEANLKMQISDLGQKLDCVRQNVKPPRKGAGTGNANKGGTACGSVIIGSDYDRDNQPRK